MSYTYLWLPIIILSCSLVSLHAEVDKLRATWRHDPATSMVIGWNQKSGSDPVLKYGVMDKDSRVIYNNSQEPDRVVWAKGMHNHFVRLSNLRPDTEYFFVIEDSEGLSDTYSFKTLPDHPDKRLSAIAGGDSRNFRKARCNANKLVAKLRPDFVLFGGDMTGGDNAEQWKAWMDDWQLTTTSNKRLIPIIVARGNHEYSNRSLIDLFDVVSSDIQYALSFGGNLLRVYTLNSLMAPGGNQKKWLEEDLNKNSHVRWKMAQYHYPIRPHTKRKRERLNQWEHWSHLFYEYGMNLVCEGDAHMVKTTFPIRPASGKDSDEGFVRDEERGTVYVGEGCWGAPLRRADDDKSWTRNSGSFNQFKWIFIAQSGMEVRTIKTDNADLVEDVGTQNRFVPPNGLNIWQPSNGPVIYIDPQEKSLLASNVTSTVDEFKATASTEGIVLSWKSTGWSDRGIRYTIDRLLPGESFKPLAAIEGANNSNNAYQIIDKVSNTEQLSAWKYRLKTNSGLTLVTGVLSHSELEVRPVADQRTGLIQIPYKMDLDSEVEINIQNDDQELVYSFTYPFQKAGSYVQSINMARYPSGHYLVVIAAGEEVLYRKVFFHQKAILPGQRRKQLGR